MCVVGGIGFSKATIGFQNKDHLLLFGFCRVLKIDPSYQAFNDSVDEINRAKPEPNLERTLNSILFSRHLFFPVSFHRLFLLAKRITMLSHRGISTHL